MARVVEARARPDDALVFAPPWAQAAFLVQYSGRPLALYGAASFAGYYYEQGNPFTQTLDLPSLEAHLRRGKRAWIVWDRIYAVRPEVPAGHTVEEERYGSTSLLLVTPPSGTAVHR